MNSVQPSNQSTGTWAIARGRKSPVLYFQTAGTDFPIQIGDLVSGEPVRLPKGMQVGIASLTGGRDKNEDTALVLVGKAKRRNRDVVVTCAVICDGMGGHWGGEIASSIAAKTIAERVIDGIILGPSPNHKPHPVEKDPADVLVEAVQSAHELVQFHVPGGGTTATVILTMGNEAVIAHVGDTRAYLVNQGKLSLHTHDHSIVQALHERGDYTPEQIRTDRHRNLLYNVVGMVGPLEVDCVSVALEPKSIALLCSDGVWGALDDSEISPILEGPDDLQTKCERLVVHASAANSSDNVSAILIRLPG